jgi:ATP/ADP translocase
MVIWSGLGFLVGAITFLLLLIAEYVTESLSRDESYYQVHGWPKLLAFFLAGAVIWPLGVYLNRKSGKVMIEKETGKEVLKPKHTFFFIRMEYWGPILFGLGIIFLFV